MGASPEHPLVLVTASANPDKVHEIEAVLRDALAGLRLLPRPPEVADVVEDGDTLLANARLKARALCEATGTAAVADDTGLFVDAIDGAPGVHTARYAGDGATYADNREKLVRVLSGVPAQQRTARFATVALVAWPDGSETWAQGSIEGVIVESPRGTQGFGYDPVFAPIETGGATGPTFAEMEPDAKHAISHRGRALRSLAAALAERASTDA